MCRTRECCRWGEPGSRPSGQADHTRATGDHLATTGRPPFDGRLTDYRPELTWTPLTLPTGWDRRHASGADPAW
jgi:hypothetical protein